MKAYAIFEGGGAKGLAHVGALAAAEKQGIEFKGVAGASAGSIVAALIACGYRSTELFDPLHPDDENAIYAVDLRSLLATDQEWKAFQSMLEDLGSLPAARSKVWSGLWFKHTHSAIVESIASKQGVFSAQGMADYLDAKLESKLLALRPDLRGTDNLGEQRRPGDPPRVLFSHVPLPLKIVATDIEGRKLIVFSQRVNASVPVATAVAASISLPFVFRPVDVSIPCSGTATIRAVDGGLLSNFPAWLFDREREVDGPHMPTFGFRLVGRGVLGAKAAPGKKPLPATARFLLDVIEIVLTGDPLLETREIENLHEIPLAVSVGTLDFYLTGQQKAALYKEGHDSADKHFARPGFPRDPDIAREALEDLVLALRDTVELDAAPLIRANIVCMTTRGTLRVTYSCHMDSQSDSDDRLEFPLGSGACSVAWKTRQPKFCDLEEAKANLSKWNMDKYQQAMVRSDLKSLLCFPILSRSGEVLGVLNLDSPDADMLKVFDDPRAVEFLPKAAKTLARILAPQDAQELT